MGCGPDRRINQLRKSAYPKIWGNRAIYARRIPLCAPKAHWHIPKDRVIPRQGNPYPPDPKYFDCDAKYGEKQPKPQRPQMFQSFRGRYTQGSIQKKPQQRQGKCLEIPFPLRYANCQRRDCQYKKGRQQQPLHEVCGTVQAQVLSHSNHGPFCLLTIFHSTLK